MKALAVVFSLAITNGLFAQTVTRSFGSVVFPGGTSSTGAGITRTFGSTVFPGGAVVPVVRGGAPVVSRPGAGLTTPGQSGQNFRRPSSTGRKYGTSYVYAYPVYVGGALDNSYAAQEPGPAQPQPPANVTIVMPPNVPQHASPVMIQAGPDGDYTSSELRERAAARAEQRRAQIEEFQKESTSDTPHYLIAFKDHTIYSAVAYWADGDTIHYFTAGNTHNQASVSLIDRELTERLNREMGTDFKLPAVK